MILLQHVFSTPHRILMVALVVMQLPVWIILHRVYTDLRNLRLDLREHSDDVWAKLSRQDGESIIRN